MAQKTLMQVDVKVMPNASANRVEGYETDAAGKTWLKVRLTITPEGGKANKELLRLLADYWGVAPSELTIVSGHKARYKRIDVPLTLNITEAPCTDS